MSLENKDVTSNPAAGSNVAADTLNGISISQIRAAVKGRVTTPDDPEYDAARTVFYGGWTADRQSWSALLVYAGDVETGTRAIAPFRALSTPIAYMVRPMSYPEIYPPEPEGYHPVAAGRTMFLDRVDQHTADVIFEHLRASSAQMAVTQIRVLGGAMARVPADATAFAHRTRQIMANVAALYQGPNDKEKHEAWAMRAKHGSAKPIRGQHGTDWWRSRLATTQPTCSGSIKTFHRPARTLINDGWCLPSRGM